MKSKTLLLLTVLSTAVVAAGCEQKKSSNPLSPSVAGPIPGVTITAPKLLSPTAGTQIETGSQPVTLLLENASTSGQRPLSYLIEVAMDADFNNKVISREGVEPGADGRTSFRLPDPLAAERTYYWRARAQDGANTGTFTSGASFSIFTPVVVGPPGLVSPLGDTQVSDRNPTLVVSNCSRSGPVGAIVYQYPGEFRRGVHRHRGLHGAGRAAGQHAEGHRYHARLRDEYFWRARAWESSKNISGPWSGTGTFRSPAAPVVTPPPSGGGGGGGGGGSKHVTVTSHSLDEARRVIDATWNEFPGLHAVFGSDGEAEAAAEELLLRTIWHLQLAGFQSARQRNPSGAISKDKMNIVIDGAWHTYDIFSLGVAGRATNQSFSETPPPNPVASSGIPD